MLLKLQALNEGAHEAALPHRVAGGRAEMSHVSLAPAYRLTGRPAAMDGPLVPEAVRFLFDFGGVGRLRSTVVPFNKAAMREGHPSH